MATKRSWEDYQEKRVKELETSTPAETKVKKFKGHKLSGRLATPMSEETETDKKTARRIAGENAKETDAKREAKKAEEDKKTEKESK